ncbi:hypothetical protein M427DRAFT_32776 [Gonapodya prolifera JEL478]|uniref:Uncharacterized protein n=1 Tax=Gonapodya prolifera (strain JEL478) TaxID=1344416 RepID=A0A139ADA3_GONPJ|nr:hypothetical protein M427DRAFT_32776 [Gonapodya prolifera JEL478]|eukprot:KXS14792.1 hypothetical protein M427DRAFT_32776 [Gonapodya prolifera JEL478]
MRCGVMEGVSKSLHISPPLSASLHLSPHLSTFLHPHISTSPHLQISTPPHLHISTPPHLLPSTINHQPSTIHHPPSTLDPRPSTPQFLGKKPGGACKAVCQCQVPKLAGTDASTICCVDLTASWPYDLGSLPGQSQFVSVDVIDVIDA